MCHLSLSPPVCFAHYNCLLTEKKTSALFPAQIKFETNLRDGLRTWSTTTNELWYKFVIMAHNDKGNMHRRRLAARGL
jgi:hypothetical protein